MADFYSSGIADTVGSVVLFMLLAVAVAVGWLKDAREACSSQEYYDATEEGVQ